MGLGSSLRTVVLVDRAVMTVSMCCQSRLVVKTALKLLIVFVEYNESNSPLLITAVNTVDNKRGFLSLRFLNGCLSVLFGNNSISVQWGNIRKYRNNAELTEI